MHIAIAGNIGAGKTTLTKYLAKHYKFKKHLEDVLKKSLPRRFLQSNGKMEF